VGGVLIMLKVVKVMIASGRVEMKYGRWAR